MFLVRRLPAGESPAGTAALAANDGTGTPARPARVGFAWNDDGIAVSFEVPAEPPLRVAVAERHGPVFSDECVEVFLASPDDPADYLEVVVNPAGVVYAARVSNPDGSRATWRVEPGVEPEGLRASARGEPRDDPAAFTSWTCDLSIPWRSLPGGRAPSAGEERRGNAYRIARGRATRFEALSPTRRTDPPDFHVPNRFARFRFVDA